MPGLLRRSGTKTVTLIGLALGAIGLATFTRISDTSSYAATVLPGLLLMSTGLSLVFVPLSNLALTGVQDADACEASAVLNSSQQIGATLGTALLNTFYASAVASHLVAHHLPPTAFNPLAAIHGYHIAFWIGVGLIAVGFIAVLVLVNAGGSDNTTQADAAAGG